jgi:hypothetical protein
LALDDAPVLTAKPAALRAWLLRFELRVAPTESQRLFALTVATGVVCGLAAVAFHFAIHFAEWLLCNRALNAPDRQWLVWGVVTPAIGGLSAGLLLKYVVPNARGSGVPQVKVAFASKEGVIPLRDALGKLVVSSLQIGSGPANGSRNHQAISPDRNEASSELREGTRTGAPRSLPSSSDHTIWMEEDRSSWGLTPDSRISSPCPRSITASP